MFIFAPNNDLVVFYQKCRLFPILPNPNLTYVRMRQIFSS